MEKQEENVNENPKVPAVPKKIRKIKRIMKSLPPKPKKAGTAFGAFLKDFWAALTPENKKRGAIKEAAAQWKDLSPKDRMKFHETVAADKTRYNKEIAQWKMAKRFNTRPASVYALYLKDLWEKEKEACISTGKKLKSIGEMGSQAAKQWADLSYDQKERYVARFQRCQRRFDASQRALKRGIDVDLNRELDVPEEFVVAELEPDNDGEEMDEFDDEEEDEMEIL